MMFKHLSLAPLDVIDHLLESQQGTLGDQRQADAPKRFMQQRGMRSERRSVPRKIFPKQNHRKSRETR